MKKVLSYVVLMIMAFALVGCGETVTPPAAGGLISEYEVKTVADLKAADSVNITFRVPFGSTITDVITEMQGEFQSEYPNVTITLEIISGYDEMKKATIADINGGTPPTMSVGYPDHFAEYLITGSIITLDKFINSTEVGYTDEEMDDFVQDYIAENRQFDRTGSYVGLPYNKSTEALYYNREFFEQFDLKVPETWAEMETVSARIMEIVTEIVETNKTKPEGEKVSYSWLGDIDTNLANEEFIPCLYDSGGNLFTTAIHQFGGEYTSSIYKSSGIVDVQTGQLKFDTSAEAKEGIQYFKDLATKKYFNLPDALTVQYGSYAYNVGKAVMNIGSTGGSSYYSSAICDTAVTTIPYHDQDHKYVIQQGTNICIFSQASDLEKLAAWLFTKYLLTPENTARLARATGYMPVRQSAYETEEYTRWLDGYTLYEDPETGAEEWIPGAVSAAAKVHRAASQYKEKGFTFFVDAAWAGSSNVRTECETAMAAILVTGEDVTKALQDAVGRIG